MALNKTTAPGNDPGKAATTDSTTASTGQGTTDHPADATGAQVHPHATYHDALSGKAVDASGNFTDGSGQVPAHRVVADDWPDRQDG